MLLRHVCMTWSRLRPRPADYERQAIHKNIKNICTVVLTMDMFWAGSTSPALVRRLDEQAEVCVSLAANHDPLPGLADFRPFLDYTGSKKPDDLTQAMTTDGDD